MGRRHRGELVGDTDDSERHEPQDRAAVGDDEQEGDDGCRRGEQAEVRPVEDGREVGLDGGGAGDLGCQAVREVCLGCLPQVADDLGGLYCVTRVHGDEHRGGSSVLRHGGGSTGRPRQRACPFLDDGQLIRGQGCVAAVEDDGRGPLCLGQLGSKLGGGLAVGAVRQRGHRGGRPLGLPDHTDDRPGAENGHQREDAGHPLARDGVCKVAHVSALP